MRRSLPRPVLLSILGGIAIVTTACGTGGMALIESAGKPGVAGSQGQADRPAPVTSGRPTVSQAEMRRFLAQQVIENLAINVQLVGPKREIVSATLFGPKPDEGMFADASVDVYCVGLKIRNFNIFEQEKKLIAILRVRQTGNILSSKFKAQPGECKSEETPFPEVVELGARRENS
ncbi:hypothetical protein [Methylobacterium oxalidis]|uniref:hypothetical protein n=1 Tax=Methylobacterium oxalidis TaxID=944322 RepID=UPI003315D812